MTRCLIVANQTLGSNALAKAVTDKLTQGISVFYVITPRTKAEQEATEWTGGYFEGVENTFLSGESRAFREQMEAMRDAARWRAQDRLNLFLNLIRSVGAEVEGEIGEADPLEAVRSALASQAPFDEILISTLPNTISRWLDMALPDKIGKLTDAKISIIHADDEPAYT
jgi:hypothetical protein